jgi:hypothetical protein
MNKIFLCCCSTLLLFSCIKHPPHQDGVHAEFYDEEGALIKESYAGQIIGIGTKEFNNPIPPNINPAQIDVTFDGVKANVQGLINNRLLVQVPVMQLYDYKDLTIRIRITNQLLRLIERIAYRPTVRATVLAGSGTGGMPDGSFNLPAEMTLDAAGNLYVIDQRNDGHDRIVRVTPTGTTSVFAGADGSFGRLVGLGFAPSGSLLYVSDATSQTVKAINVATPASVSVLAGSGTAGNTDGSGTAASFRFGDDRVDNFGTNEKGQGMTVDAAGNVFVGERGSASTSFSPSIRRITPAGVVSTVAGSVIVTPSGPDDLISPNGVSLNAAGEPVYTTGASGFYQGLIRVSSGGSILRLAGKISNETLKDGMGAAAEFCYPKALQFRNTYQWVADGSNGAIRRVDAAGNVITIAGVGHFSTPSFLPCATCVPTAASYVWPSFLDSNPDRFKIAAAAIRMDQVGGIAVRSGNLMYVSDYGPNFRCIWKVTIE